MPISGWKAVFENFAVLLNYLSPLLNNINEGKERRTVSTRCLWFESLKKNESFLSLWNRKGFMGEITYSILFPFYNDFPIT